MQKWISYSLKLRKVFNTDSPHSSPQRVDSDRARSPSPALPKQSHETQINPGSTSGPPKQTRTSFKVTLEDPTWLKSTASTTIGKTTPCSFVTAQPMTTESSGALLASMKNPFSCFRRSKKGIKKPVFMLKHIDNVPPPISVAKKKHAARKVSSNMFDGSGTTTSTDMEVGTSAPWIVSTSRTNKTMTSTLVATSNGVQSVIDISYAFAIYPYLAEQSDELDVVVGEKFVITSRARGWWVVQRDPTGSGVVDMSIFKQGWVPAGCFLQTNVPVTSAMMEAATAKPTTSTTSASPILPLNISFPGIALMDYKKKGEEELDLVKDDAFKRYNHWTYVVKEIDGDRGWVPSWFIGKTGAANVDQVVLASSFPPAGDSLGSAVNRRFGQFGPRASSVRTHLPSPGLDLMAKPGRRKKGAISRNRVVWLKSIEARRLIIGYTLGMSTWIYDLYEYYQRPAQGAFKIGASVEVDCEERNSLSPDYWWLPVLSAETSRILLFKTSSNKETSVECGTSILIK
ncbi:hypothetical protein DFH07DRAFT_89697 [Mycena maculata]|uniref:SH3 domain-containing protein n=1 Tax=Mycena maculata TaxID=230809 RepID=A0AAD7K0P4_9AGAR|nr:hypothetical protein DFH07DRAFT_89697 [Mycena maculata]